MIYEIINPSDKYTLESDSLLIACLTVCILGQGNYGLQGENGESMPPFIFGGHDEWFTEKFGKPFSELLDETPPAVLAECFESVVIGDRELYQETLLMLPDETRAKWIEQWNDKNRSSLNDIGGRAKAIAERSREGESQ